MIITIRSSSSLTSRATKKIYFISCEMFGTGACSVEELRTLTHVGIITSQSDTAVIRIRIFIILSHSQIAQASLRGYPDYDLPSLLSVSLDDA